MNPEANLLHQCYLAFSSLLVKISSSNKVADRIIYIIMFTFVLIKNTGSKSCGLSGHNSSGLVNSSVFQSEHFGKLRIPGPRFFRPWLQYLTKFVLVQDIRIWHLKKIQQCESAICGRHYTFKSELYRLMKQSKHVNCTTVVLYTLCV